MKPARFDYHRATSVADAAQLLAETSGKVLAGGQSLVPIMSMRLASPSALVDINRIDGLGDITVDDDAVRIGALVRHRALELHEGAYAANPLLRRTLQQVAHPTIRNRGTTVGSLVHADPAAEMPAVLALLGGSVEAVSHTRGRRSIAAADFVTGPLECCLLPDEVAVAAVFPHPGPGSGSAWLEISRRRGDYAVVGVGAVVQAEAGVVTSATVALISVGGTPCVVDLSEALSGRPAEALDSRGIDELLMAAIDPESDIHASAEYRAQLARILTARALTEAARDALPRAATQAVA